MTAIELTEVTEHLKHSEHEHREKRPVRVIASQILALERCGFDSIGWYEGGAAPNGGSLWIERAPAFIGSTLRFKGGDVMNVAESVEEIEAMLEPVDSILGKP